MNLSFLCGKHLLMLKGRDLKTETADLLRYPRLGMFLREFSSGLSKCNARIRALCCCAVIVRVTAVPHFSSQGSLSLLGFLQARAYFAGDVLYDIVLVVSTSRIVCMRSIINEWIFFWDAWPTQRRTSPRTQ